MADCLEWRASFFEQPEGPAVAVLSFVIGLVLCSTSVHRWGGSLPTLLAGSVTAGGGLRAGEQFAAEPRGLPDNAAVMTQVRKVETGAGRWLRAPLAVRSR